jgi:hypothetical protein
LTISAEKNDERKEVETMRYEKPEVALVDAAIAAIEDQAGNKTLDPVHDGIFPTDPAYQADE